MLCVGRTVAVQTDQTHSDDQRVLVTLRGWLRGQYLIVDRPRAPNGFWLALQEHQHMVVRFVHNSHACAFDTKVLDWDTRPRFPMMRLRWPDHIQRVGIRLHERYTMQGAVEADYQIAPGEHQILKGELVDISLGGCALAGPFALDDGTPLTLSFELPDGAPVHHLKAKIRSVRAFGRHYLAGCSFDASQETDDIDRVAFYIAARCEQHRLNTGLDGAVLVLDVDEERCRHVRHRLESAGHRVYNASNMPDGLVLLRMHPPAVLVAGGSLGCANCLSGLLLREQYSGTPVLRYATGSESRKNQPAIQGHTIEDGPGWEHELAAAVQEVLARNAAKGPTPA